MRGIAPTASGLLVTLLAACGSTVVDPGTPAGTRIRLDRIERHRYPGLETWYSATGTIESGEFRGVEVNLGFISSAVPGSRMHRVNPQELQRAEQPTSGG